MKYIVSLVVGLLLAGCATGYNPSYRFKQIEVVNLSGGALQNLSWNVVGSGQTKTCGEVPSKTVCGEYFAQRNYPRAGIELSWTHVDGERKSEVINPSVPGYFYTGLPLRIIVEINPDASLRAYYDQDTPDGDLIIRRR